jgi:hypothetical protein
MQPRGARHTAESQPEADSLESESDAIAARAVEAEVEPEAEEPVPSFSEQMAEQLGGVRGLVESSIPVTLFVIVNFIGEHTKAWPLRTSLIVAVGVALLMAGFRLSRKQPIRHALNGVFGVAIGAFIALRSNDARDFYLPGILISAAYAVAMIASVLFRRPLVGWIWAVMADKGATRWRDEPKLVKLFGWLTVLWALVYLLKTVVQSLLYLAHQTDLLGIARLALGWPPYILLAAFTVWRVRRVTHGSGEPASTTGAPA